MSNFELSNIEIIINRPLDTKDLQTTYPTKSMPFFLYGTGSQAHIDHVLFTSPNTQLNSDQVDLQLGLALDMKETYCCRLQLPEQAMQPLPANKYIASDAHFFFRPGVKYDVAIFKDTKLNEDGDKPITTGTIVLGKVAFADTDMLNENPLPSHHGDVTFFKVLEYR